MNGRRGRLHGLVVRRPGTVAILGLALAGIAAAYAVRHFKVETGTQALVSEEHPQSRAWLDLVHEFGTPEALVLVLEHGEPDALREFARRLAPRLEARKDYVRSVFYGRDLSFPLDRALYLLPPEVFDAFVEAVHVYRPVAADLARDPSYARLIATIRAQLEARMQAGDGSASPTAADRALGEVLRGLGRNLNEALEGGPARSPLDVALPVDDRMPLDPAQGFPPRDPFLYNLAPDGRGGWLLFVIVFPASDANDFEWQKGLLTLARTTAADVRREAAGGPVGDVLVRMTGPPALNVDEMVTTRRDNLLASCVSFGGVALLFTLGFGRARRTVLALLALLVAVGITFGAAMLFIGHLNLLSMAFATILAGLGIEYGIVFLERHQEELSRRLPHEATLQALLGTRRGILTGCLTSVAAFLATFIVMRHEFKGFAELGLATAIGLVAALFSMLCLLPALVCLEGRGGGGPIPAAALSRAIASTSRRPLPTVLIGLALSGLAAFAAWRGLRFDGDIMNLQVEGTESARQLKVFLSRAPFSTEFAAVVVHDLEDARALAALIRERQARGELKTVLEVHTAADLVPRAADQEARHLRLREVAGQIPRLRAPSPGSSPAGRDPDAALAETARLRSALEHAAELAFSAGRAEDVRFLEDVGADLERAGETARKLDRNALAGRLAAFETAILADLERKLDFLERATLARPYGVADLPPLFRERFVGRTGKHLVYIAPQKHLESYDPVVLEPFVKDVRSVAPWASGHPLFLHDMIGLIKGGYAKAGIAAVVAVLVMLLADFRSLKATALALIPLVAGGTWAAGALAALDIPLNPANLIALPLVVGVGIDLGIYFVHGYLEEVAVRGRSAAGTARAIDACAGGVAAACTLSAMASIVGFGSLGLSSHVGLSTMGTTLALGMASCLFACLTLLPAVLRLLGGPASEPPVGRQLRA